MVGIRAIFCFFAWIAPEQLVGNLLVGRSWVMLNLQWTGNRINIGYCLQGGTYSTVHTKEYPLDSRSQWQLIEASVDALEY